MPIRPVVFAFILFLGSLQGYAAEETKHAAMNNAAVEAQLADSVRLLAGDELEGRGVGTKGIDKAADYLAERFAALGLKTDLFDGSPFQKFTMTVGTEMGKPNRAELVGPGQNSEKNIVQLKLGETFNPLSIGGSGKLDAPLVFVGYGITAPDLNYDDYAGLNVEGKAVIVLRHEPEQANPHSAFEGTKHSQYAPFSRKLSNAYEHGAAAVIFLTDEYEIYHRVLQRLKAFDQPLDELLESQENFNKLVHPTLDEIEQHQKTVDKLVNDKMIKEMKYQGEKLRGEYDPLLPFRGAGSGDAGRIPVLFCRRSVIAPMVKAATSTDLATLEREIDRGPTPHSKELTGWRLTGEITVNRTEAEVKNVLAELPGSGPHADETIVIGAHYDHLGWGGEGSFVPDKKEIHNGADDNASGTAALLEVARRLASLGHPLPRRVVFIAFTGEERGLLGSARYCAHPLVPLDKTVAMLNMDMVGRLTDDKLIIQGFDTAPEFRPMVDQSNERLGFKISTQSGGFGPSDHSSFYGHKIPVLHFFTGVHKDYHRPTDDFEKINVPGMRRVAELVADVAVSIAESDTRPTYTASKEKKGTMGSGGDRPYFGSVPDFAQDEPGYKLSGVSKDGPAEKAGIQAGDIIIKLGDSRIGNLEDFDSALRKHKAGDKVPVIVKRDGTEVTITVTLDPPR
ncbi:MAG TPA: M20/M25/M40 family metallo-hydrolase [Pirellulales bacterium]|jgi:hypothetical protein|nr:M20/M25/M40 family metallo-hydrolase [Pirellulales bacterium]